METFSASLAICKGQWRGALMISLICVWISGWVNNHEVGDLRRYYAHFDVTVMIKSYFKLFNSNLARERCISNILYELKARPGIFTLHRTTQELVCCFRKIWVNSYNSWYKKKCLKHKSRTQIIWVSLSCNLPSIWRTSLMMSGRKKNIIHWNLTIYVYMSCRRTITWRT